MSKPYQHETKPYPTPEQTNERLGDELTNYSLFPNPPFELLPTSQFRWPQPHETQRVGWFYTAKINRPVHEPVKFSENLYYSGWVLVEANQENDPQRDWAYYLAPKSSPLQLSGVSVEVPESSD